MNLNQSQPPLLVPHGGHPHHLTYPSTSRSARSRLRSVVSLTICKLFSPSSVIFVTLVANLILMLNQHGSEAAATPPPTSSSQNELWTERVQSTTTATSPIPSYQRHVIESIEREWRPVFKDDDVDTSVRHPAIQSIDNPSDIDETLEPRSLDPIVKNVRLREDEGLERVHFHSNDTQSEFCDLAFINDEDKRAATHTFINVSDSIGLSTAMDATTDQYDNANTNSPIMSMEDSPHHLTKRAAPTVKTIETAVFVDKDLINKYEGQEQQLKRLIMTIMNEVQLIYNFRSMKTKIKIVLVKLEFLKEGMEAPNQAGGDIDKYLDNFCIWQARKFRDEYRKNRYDHALMLTGLDLFKLSNGKRNKKVLGLAWVNGMCKPSYSCTLNEGKNFEAAFVIAHEMAHSLGILHDGRGNNCDPEKYIMSEKTGPGKINWSPCSNVYLENFLSRGNARCLDDESPVSEDLDYESTGRLPGEKYPANVQCQLALGPQYRAYMAPKEPFNNICRELWCLSGSWATPAHPALEGTDCAEGKKCYQGICVQREAIPPPPGAGGQQLSGGGGPSHVVSSSDAGYVRSGESPSSSSSSHHKRTRNTTPKDTSTRTVVNRRSVPPHEHSRFIGASSSNSGPTTRPGMGNNRWPSGGGASGSTSGAYRRRRPQNGGEIQQQSQRLRGTHPPSGGVPYHHRRLPSLASSASLSSGSNEQFGQRLVPYSVIYGSLKQSATTNRNNSITSTTSTSLNNNPRTNGHYESSSGSGNNVGAGAGSNGPSEAHGIQVESGFVESVRGFFKSITSGAEEFFRLLSTFSPT